MAVMAAPPLALVTSIVGLFTDKSKKYAIAGVVISVLTCCLIVLLLLGALFS